MLQQTRVDAVVPYYERFLEEFPDVHTLAQASEEDVLRLWSGLGYYRRAKMLHKAASIVSEDCEGAFPRSQTEWQELPGIGEYTSAAIASIAHGEAVGVVDGNVRRVVARHGALRLRANDRKLHQHAQNWMATRMTELAEVQEPGSLNQAVMELGATICTPANPNCDVCPLKIGCAAAGKNAATFPLSAKRAQEIALDICFFLAEKDGMFLLRPCTGRWTKGLWEPPSLECCPDSQLQDLWSQSGETGMIGSRLGAVRHRITKYKIHAHFFRLEGARKDQFVAPESVPLSGLGKKAIRAYLST
ncbi:MAG: A/G-specific adenine glycosylase [Planctomycetota bacterium]|jgi:A/G-specific adenine glycosylase|nr:A/G-specific adenine glycosylase [Planctomycetota bacterium]MDP6940825.1 A/G-specific adenine glycosylase [Planctomycetota bacterium]